MSELITTNKRCDRNRWQLLVSVSAAALIGSTYISGAIAAGDDSDRPTIWIELGGQLERIDTAHPLFEPAFLDASKPQNQVPMLDSQKPPAYGVGGEGKITFAPESSNWVFSAAIRYGRSNGAKHVHHQSPVLTPEGNPYPTSRLYFGDGQTKFHESHYMLDFKAGRDVGLGMFGSGSTSVVSAGIRFAQFNSSSNVALHARPYDHPTPTPALYGTGIKYNVHVKDYSAALQANRSTHAIGPSLAWDASLPLVRRDEKMVVELDWGLNAAVLFGRQKVQVHHQTSQYVYNFTWGYGSQKANTVQIHDPNRARSVTIPNVGGFAALSLKFPNAKVALGYRADMFFNAVDNGIDTRRSENIGFYGPFATISIGLGG